MTCPLVSARYSDIHTYISLMSVDRAQKQKYPVAMAKPTPRCWFLIPDSVKGTGTPWRAG